MSRNAESHFAVNPTRIDMSRSRFDRSSSYKTTFNVGQIIPFYVDEVLPGDTFSIDTSKVVRMQTLLTPVMDDIFLDTYYFFVPNRLTWNHWKQFMGENTESAWIPSVEYEIPQLTAPEGGWNIGTIAVKIPASGPTPDASASAIDNGSAMIATMIPAVTSLTNCSRLYVFIHVSNIGFKELISKKIPFLLDILGCFTHNFSSISQERDFSMFNSYRFRLILLRFFLPHKLHWLMHEKENG